MRPDCGDSDSEVSLIWVVQQALRNARADHSTADAGGCGRRTGVDAGDDPWLVMVITVVCSG